MEVNSPPCPLHGALPRALHSENFEGIVIVIEELLETVSGVGTLSYARCPHGYPYNFEGVVRALEDLNVTVSGLRTSSVVPGSGISIRPSGDFEIFDVNALGIGGVSVVYSGTVITISGTNNVATAVVSGVVAGAGIIVTASGGSAIISTNLSGLGSVEFNYDGTGVGLISGVDTSAVLISGSPAPGYSAGALWFDTAQGRLFVYASGNGVANPDWYQTNAEALAIMSEIPPSGRDLMHRHATVRFGLTPLWVTCSSTMLQAQVGTKLLPRLHRLMVVPLRLASSRELILLIIVWIILGTGTALIGLSLALVDIA
jgi:hypothetical protein